MKLAIYDFDGTYIDVQTLPFLFKMWKDKKINIKSFNKIWHKIKMRYILNKLNLFGWDKQTFRANAMELTADLFNSVERETLNEFLVDFYNTIQPHVSKGIRSKLHEDKKNGYYTVLLSGNYNIILEPFLRDGFDQVIGTDINKGNELKSSKEVEIIINQRKQDIIRETFPNANFEDSKAYADSDYDLPIFELVGHPIAVNPDKELLNIAKARNYEVLITK